MSQLQGANLSGYKRNLICLSDSYKYSQWNQYPERTEYVYSYIESRGGEWDKTLFIGIQPFVKEFLLTPITMEDINEAEELLTAHGEPFYREGWEYILREHNGYMPVVIKAAPEGCLIPTKNVLVTIENTDPKCWWLTSFLETMLLRAVWYMTTVATNSYESRKIILAALEKTGDPSLIDFKLHDFGARGVSSEESAMLGGMAHLSTGFMGTDTVSALIGARRFYGASIAGFSIPAMEHSTVTSWGRDREVDSYRNMLKRHGKPGAPIAFVSDSYDIYNACKMWGTELKQDVIDSGAIVVVRPDSGEPSVVVVKCLYILEKYFGSVKNAKGYRVLNNVRVIQGDGINQASIHSILFAMDIAGFSADNVAFGQGGALLQQVNRDTMRFAMKCSAIGVREMVLNNEENFPNDGSTEIKTAGLLPKLVWRDVFKDPITDSGKASKKGRVTLYKSGYDYISGIEGVQPNAWADKKWEVALEEVYRDGKLLRDMTFDEVRANAKR